jgi:hypothetical protein
VVVTETAKNRDVHIRKHPDDAAAKPVWCGATNAASITEAWGYYGPGGNGHDEVCRACVDAQRAVQHLVVGGASK